MTRLPPAGVPESGEVERWAPPLLPDDDEDDLDRALAAAFAAGGK